MIDINKITKALANFHTLRLSDDGAQVGTSCLFPHGDNVTIVVRHGKNGYIVSDDGLGWNTILSSGTDIKSSHTKKALKIAEETGLVFDQGSFVLNEINDTQLGSGIAWVANATQRWVSDVFFTEQRRTEYELRQRIFDVIVHSVPRDKIEKDISLIGDSNRHYVVDCAVKLSNDNLVLVQGIMNNSNSITTNFVKLVDIKKAHPKFHREVAVEGVWKAEDLNLISEASEEIIQIDRQEKLLSRKIKSLVGT
ncbi:MAG: DUF1828 domain-containing protein [Alphaproteobacteria bacterium]|nr:DUF1828 domain-containing protein [Alphaproteobacteria bacterium]